MPRLFDSFSFFGLQCLVLSANVLVGEHFLDAAHYPVDIFMSRLRRSHQSFSWLPGGSSLVMCEPAVRFFQVSTIPNECVFIIFCVEDIVEDMYSSFFCGRQIDFIERVFKPKRITDWVFKNRLLRPQTIKSWKGPGSQQGDPNLQILSELRTLLIRCGL